MYVNIPEKYYIYIKEKCLSISTLIYIQIWVNFFVPSAHEDHRLLTFVQKLRQEKNKENLNSSLVIWKKSEKGWQKNYIFSVHLSSLSYFLLFGDSFIFCVSLFVYSCVLSFIIFFFFLNTKAKNFLCIILTCFFRKY